VVWLPDGEKFDGKSDMLAVLTQYRGLHSIAVKIHPRVLRHPIYRQ